MAPSTQNLSILELATDVFSLALRMMSWMLLVWSPIGLLVTGFVIGAQNDFPLWQSAILGVVAGAISIGFALLGMWLSTGVINRYHKRMITVSLLVFLFSVLSLLIILVGDLSSSTLLVSQVIQTAFLVGFGVILFISAIKSKRLARANADN